MSTGDIETISASSEPELMRKARSKSRASTIKETVRAVFQTRYIILAMCGLTNLFAYCTRSNINLTIVAMVKSEKDKLANPTYGVCGFDDFSLNMTQSNHSSGEEDDGDGEFDWPESLQGVILGSYFAGYLLTNINAGHVTQMFGCRLVLTLAMAFSSILTFALHPLAHLHPYWLIAARFVIGLAQGLLTPPIWALLANWIPKDQLGLAYSIVGCAGNIGAMITLPLSALVIEYAGWPWVFYVTGAISLAFVPFWWFLVYNTPWEHPRIHDTELLYLKATVAVPMDDGEKKTKDSIPWCSILTSTRVWLFAFSRFSGAWGSLLLMAKLPDYLETVLRMSIESNGYVNAAIYLALGSSLIAAGRLSDYLGKHTSLTPTSSRRLFQTIALGVPAICIALVPLMGCNAWGVVCLLVCSMLAYGCIAGSEFLIAVDVAPAYSSTIYGLTNSVANLAGFFSPFFVGLFIDSSDIHSKPMEQWSRIFYFTSSVYILGVIAFWFVRAEPESWARRK